MTTLTVEPYLLVPEPKTSVLFAYQAVWHYASEQLRLLGCDEVTFDVVAGNGVVEAVTFDNIGQVGGMLAVDWFDRFIGSAA